MLVTSLVTSVLMTKEKFLTQKANERGEESQILYMISSKLFFVLDMEAVLMTGVDSMSRGL